MKRTPRSHRLSPKWAAQLPDLAQDQSWFWGTGVQRQHERLKQDIDAYGTDGKILDAIQYILCLRNLIRAAHLVQDALQPYANASADYWLRRLHERVPGVVKARNFVEHFDEYALGLGRLQKEGSRTPLRINVEGSKDEPLKIVLVSSGRRVQIDMDKATEAAAHLCIGLYIARDVADEMRDAPEPGSPEWLHLEAETIKNDPDANRRPKILRQATRRKTNET